MKRLVLGPTFEASAGDDLVGAVGRLTEWVASPDCPFAGTSLDHHFQLHIRRDAGRHFWSPWLTLDVRDDGDGATAFGRFNPSPAIWTAYILGSLGLITIAFVALMWGWSQWQINRPPTAFWVIPVCVVVGALMWGASAFGQRLARDEMRAMEDAVREVLS